MAEENRSWGDDRIVGGRWPIWDLRSPTKRWELFCDATACRPRRSASARPRGRPSFGPTWRCWRGPTFSRRRCSRCVGWRPTTCCSHPSREPPGATIAGITDSPGRAVDEANGPQRDHGGMRHACGTVVISLHDRDTKYTQSFRAIIASGRVEPLALPARSPNLNAYAERWVRSVKEECLSKVILFGERSLRRAPERICRTLSMPSGIIRGRAMSCCSLAIQTFTARASCNAASDWVGSCAIIIKRQRDRTPKVHPKL